MPGSTVTPQTNAVVLVLINENNVMMFALEQRSFEIQITKARSTVILCSTVTALWAKETSALL